MADDPFIKHIKALFFCWGGGSWPRFDGGIGKSNPFIKHIQPATVDGLEILHQLRLVVFPIIYKVLAPSQMVFSPDF